MQTKCKLNIFISARIRLTLIFSLAAGVPAAAQNVIPGAEQASAGSQHRGIAKSTRPTPKAFAKLAAVSGAQAPLTLLGQVATSSPSESFAISGNTAYVCGDNDVSIINIANPANLQITGTVLSSLIRNTGLIYCSIQRNSLVVFADQSNTNIGNNPGFAALSLANPTQPVLIANTPVNKRFFQPPVYVGNLAFVPTSAIQIQFGWNDQNGDLVAVDISNFANPTIVGTLETPQVHPQYGGVNPVFRVVQAGPSLLYVGGTSNKPGAGNTGVGRIQAVDITNPAAMKVTAQVSVPGTVHFLAPQIQGKTAVGIGNTGGSAGSLTANPADFGNIVVATFDMTDPKYPSLLASVKTNYVVGLGDGATRIGNNLFAFAGVSDPANGIPLLLVVDATDPRNPGIQAYPTGQAFTSIQAIGSTLYASMGSNGFAAYSIPGNVATSLSCPLSFDMVVVFDRSATISSAGFNNVKASLRSFTNAMHLPTDKLGVVTFDQAAALTQILTTDPSTAKKAIDNLVPSASTVAGSYVGAGIVSAQLELTSARHAASATPLMIVVSDGADRGAPNASATLSAANAAKAVGTRVIAVQYGSGSSALMQSIASSLSDFYLVPAP